MEFRRNRKENIIKRRFAVCESIKSCPINRISASSRWMSVKARGNLDSSARRHELKVFVPVLGFSAEIIEKCYREVWASFEPLKRPWDYRIKKIVPLFVRRRQTSSIPSRSFKRWQCHVPSQDLYCGFRSKIILIQLCVLFSGWLSWNSIRDVPQEVCLHPWAFLILTRKNVD